MADWRFTGKNPLLQPNEQFTIGVSFPAQFLPNYTPTAQSGGGFDISPNHPSRDSGFRGNLHLHIHRLPGQQKQLLNPQSQHGNLGR